MDDDMDILDIVLDEILADLDALETPDTWGIRIVLENASGERIARLYPRTFATETGATAMMEIFSAPVPTPMMLRHVANLSMLKAWDIPDGQWTGIFQQVVKVAMVPF